MTVPEKYLRLYKEWENLLRDSGTDVRTIESQLETSDPAKFARVRMCRLFRNYLTHEDDVGFLAPTDTMFGFLEAEVKALKLQDDVVKKHLRYTKNYLFEPGFKCSEVLGIVLPNKIDTIVRSDDTGCVLVSVFDIAMAALESKTKKLSVVKALRQKPVYCEPLDKIALLDSSKIHVCTSDGTAKGDILGVVKF